MRFPFLAFALATAVRAYALDFQLVEDLPIHTSACSLIQVHAHHAKQAHSDKGGLQRRQDGGGRGYSMRLADGFVARSPELPNGDSSTPYSINELDVWGIRDLLLLGKASPLLQDGSAGKPVVVAAAETLAEMLPQIHPVPACQTAVGLAVGLEAKAAACWSCLGLNPTNFTNPYLPNSTKFQNAANTDTKFGDLMGACSGTRWPRACSYWSSFHAMGVLADVHGQGRQFLQAISRIIAGGALYCGGCTLHWRYLNKHMLPSALHDVGDLLPY